MRALRHEGGSQLECFWNITRGGMVFGGAYNAAPTQKLPVIRVLDGERSLDLMR